METLRNIGDMIEDTYDLSRFPAKRLHHGNEPILRREVGIPEITPDNVVIDSISEEEGIVWTFDLTPLDDGVYWGSEKTGSRRSTYLEKYKIRHEFVSEAIMRGNTDKKLRECFHEELDEDDHLTPDFVWLDHRGHAHVVEIATSRNDSYEKLQSILEEKRYKYVAPLVLRSEGRIACTFDVIVISHSSIMSSLHLDQSLRRELIVRFRIGIALEDKARSMGILFEFGESDVIREEMTGRILGQIQQADFLSHCVRPSEKPAVSAHPLTITRDYIDSLKVEPVELAVTQTYVNCFQEAVADANASADENESHWTKKILEYQHKNTVGDRKYPKKAVVNLPLFLAEATESNVDVMDMHITPEESVVESKMWQVALCSYMSQRELNVEENATALICEALETNQRSVEFYQESRKSKRSKYHRVNIASSLREHEKELMAEQGLWAKKHKNDEFCKERRKISQKPFSWTTDTSDISDFLDRADLLEDDPAGVFKHHDGLLKLLLEANQISENSTKGVSVVESWMSTKLYRSLDLISDIACELVVANKQNCRQGYGIVKKLRYHNAYILIFPTKSSEHVFFTLYFPSGTVLCDGPFRDSIGIREGWITKLCSAKQGKLENWCSASSMLISLVSFWSWFYELESDKPQAFIGHKESTKMLLLSILIRLEDKSCTEEAITQLRYCYMEVFKNSFNPVKARPLKMLSKFSTKIRSRLELWVISSAINNFYIMTINQPIRLDQEAQVLEEGEDALPRDSWSGLLNCYTGKEVVSATKIINLMYLGYLKNKNESPEGNTDFALVKKTLEEEMKLDWGELHKSKGDVDSTKESVKGKQFSKNCMLHGCSVMEKRLEKKLGENWKELIGEEIVTALSKHMSEELATLKASSSLTHVGTPAAASYTPNVSAMRIKVLEAIKDKIQKIKLNPFTAIVSIVEEIEGTSKGVIADLFKKQQHGGLREIYVLTLESRIVQLFVETAARILCSHFEEETLTHPKNKLIKLDEHRRLAARLTSKRNCTSVDFCSSSDKTRWNQNFVMPAMIIPLIRLTPTRFHALFARILNLWTSKLIKLPQSVVNLLLNRVQLESEEFNFLASEFWAPSSENGIMNFQGADCVRLTTGMMQGILHYLSSLVHLCFLNSSSVILRKIFNTKHPEYLALITQVCSSDDSGTMFSVLTPSESRILTPSDVTAFATASLLLETLPKVCGYYCMIDSIKSTSSVLNYIEFNSEFMFDNTIAMPVIKFVAASLTLSESESFVERFHTQYNLIADLFGSGFTAEHTHLCQMAQALLHYKSLGSSTNALFEKWTEGVLQYPDPKFGFFLLDCSLCPGVLGYSFGHWLACISTPIFQKSVFELNTEPWVATPEGGIMQSLTIKHGEVKRWKSMVNRVSNGMRITDEIEKIPEILFRRAKTIDELKLKLAIKATSPGVAKSMRRGNPFIQAFAMSVYAINTHSFTKMSIIKGFDDRVRVPTKVCILGELDRLTNPERREVMGAPDKKSISMAFPNVDRYIESLAIIRHCRESLLVRCHRFRHRRTEVIVQTSLISVPLSLYETLGHHWFGLRVRASNRVFKKCLDFFCTGIPWIRSTMKATLSESPFTTYQELFGFINTDRKKSRHFRRNGPGNFSRRLKGQLYGLIRKSQRPSMVMRETAPEVSRVVDSDFITKINLGLSLPESPEKERHISEALVRSPLMAHNFAEIDSMSRRDATLAFIQGIVKREFNVEEVVSHMREMGLGTHVAYVLEQRKAVGADGATKWIGNGDCYIIIEGSLVRIRMIDEVIKSMTVDNPVKLRASLGSLREVLKELGLKQDVDSSIPRGCIAKFNGKNLASPRSSGTPVFYMSDAQVVHFTTHGVQVDYVGSTILLSQTVRSNRGNIVGKVTILKYSMSFSDIIQERSKAGSGLAETIWQAWMEQMPIDPRSMIELLLTKDSITKPVITWLRETLQARLQALGLAFFNLSYYETVDSMSSNKDSDPLVITDEEVRVILRGLSGYIASGESKLYEVAQSKDSIEDWVEESEEETSKRDKEAIDTLMSYGLDTPVPEWLVGIHNLDSFVLEETGSVIMPLRTNFMSVHSMWDEVIRGFHDEHSQFWSKVMSGMPMIGDLKAPSLCFMDLLGTADSPTKYPSKKRGEGLGSLFSSLMEASKGKERAHQKKAVTIISPDGEKAGPSKLHGVASMGIGSDRPSAAGTHKGVAEDNDGQMRPTPSASVTVEGGSSAGEPGNQGAEEAEQSSTAEEDEDDSDFDLDDELDAMGF